MPSQAALAEIEAVAEFAKPVVHSLERLGRENFAKVAEDTWAPFAKESGGKLPEIGCNCHACQLLRPNDDGKMRVDEEGAKRLVSRLDFGDQMYLDAVNKPLAELLDTTLRQHHEQATVLELGPGVVTQIADQVNLSTKGRGQYIGVDLSLPFLSKQRETLDANADAVRNYFGQKNIGQFGSEDERAKFIERAIGRPALLSVGDVRALPLKSGSVDVVVSNALPDESVDAFREIHRVLKPGGQYLSMVTQPLALTADRNTVSAVKAHFDWRTLPVEMDGVTHPHMRIEKLTKY